MGGGVRDKHRHFFQPRGGRFAVGLVDDSHPELALVTLAGMGVAGFQLLELHAQLGQAQGPRLPRPFQGTRATLDIRQLVGRKKMVLVIGLDARGLQLLESFY